MIQCGVRILACDKVASYTEVMSGKRISISFPYEDREIAAQWWVENHATLAEQRKLIVEFYHTTDIAICYSHWVGYYHWVGQYSRFRWAAKWIAETGLGCVEQLRDLARAEGAPDSRLEALRESADQMLDSFSMQWPDDSAEIRRFRNAAGRIIGVLEELEEEVLATVFSAVSFTE